jgi:hypothetical protein
MLESDSKDTEVSCVFILGESVNVASFKKAPRGNIHRSFYVFEYLFIKELYNCISLA